MKIYRITENGNFLNEIEADKVQVLASGQIVFDKNEEIVAVFSPTCNVFDVSQEYVSEKERMIEFLKERIEKIDEVDEWFRTDVFFKKNSVEEANIKLRKICGLLYSMTYEIDEITK